MDEHERKARAAYYRQFYQVRDADALERPTRANPLIDSDVITAAQHHFDTVMAKLTRAPQRLTRYGVEADTEQKAYITSHYGDVPPHGIGIKQGEYATVARSEVNDSNRFIATDNLVDCHALVLVARDAKGQVQQTLLGHIDAKTNAASTIKTLMKHIPKDSQVEATVLGSPNSQSFYLQADLMEALAANAQVTRIRYNFDAATAVAVDTSTGKLLTSTGPIKSADQAYKITNMPVNITFREYPNQTGLLQHLLDGNAFRILNPNPHYGLWQAYDPIRNLRTEDELSTFISDRVSNDGKVNAQELQEIAAKIGETITTNVSLKYQPGENGLVKIDILTAEGVRISKFWVAKLDPALGESGTIQPANTPPAPGRGLATNTTSQPSDTAPTGRRSSRIP